MYDSVMFLYGYFICISRVGQVVRYRDIIYIPGPVIVDDSELCLDMSYELSDVCGQLVHRIIHVVRPRSNTSTFGTEDSKLEVVYTGTDWLL